MRVGILGSGLLGGKLGTLFARAGYEVVFSFSRSQKKLERLARDAGGEARAGTTTAYSFGDNISDLGRYAWYGEDFASGGTHPVG